MACNCHNCQSRHFPNVPYWRLWLELHKRYRLKRKLGQGIGREGWLARGGKVVKLPRMQDKQIQWNAYLNQTSREAELIAAGKDRYGAPVARGEIIHVFGVPIIVMEYVIRTEEYYPTLDALPRHHRRAQLHKQEKIRSIFINTADGQFGLTTDGRPVYYDAGYEVP